MVSVQVRASPPVAVKLLRPGTRTTRPWRPCETPLATPHANALAEAADRVHYELEKRLIATPATTPDGWRVKAKLAAHILGDEPDGTYEDHLTRSLLADILCAPA